MSAAQRLVPPPTAFRSPSRRSRKPRVKNESHLDFIRRLPCAVCGDRATVEAAHIRFGNLLLGKRQVGMGERPDDRWTVPLCSQHHREQHRGNERGWWAAQGADPTQIAAGLALHSGDHDVCEQIIAAWRARNAASR